MSDVPIQGEALRRLAPHTGFRAADDSETPPADDVRVRPAGLREPPLPPPSHGRADAEPGRRPSSRRRLPTGLY